MNGGYSIAENSKEEFLFKERLQLNDDSLYRWELYFPAFEALKEEG
jgi:hypothetical protein